MIHLSDISKGFGEKTLYRKASFQINTGEKIGLVGPNGAGKTTLFRMITGEDRPDEGRVSRPDKVRVAYFSQTVAEMSGRTVFDEVKSSIPGLSQLMDKLSSIEKKLSEVTDDDEMQKLLETYGDLQAEFEKIGGYSIDSKIAEILTGLGIPPEDQQRLTDTFSGGWKMRIALAKVLIQNPDVLLMDEPTNHLDMESIVWLESWIAQFEGALLMTSHDRDFMNRLVSKIVEVAHKTITVYGGNYDFYDREKEIRKTQLIAAARRQEDMLAKEEEFIARFAARASHAAQVQSRVKKLEKIDRIEIPPEEKVMDFEWPVPPRGGDEVLKLNGLTKIYKTPEGREKLVFKNANALVKRGDRVAVVGVNGAGKSTLLKIVNGDVEATDGQAVVGASIEVGYFSQNSLDVLNPQNTILDEVHARIPQASDGMVRTLLGAFLFSGDDVEKKISILSGGEKSRVVLATILARPVNFLVLDEPTNHLDIASREMLLKAIQRFPGTVMMVSHDRYFLRQITNRVFEVDKHQLLVYDRTWDEYTEYKSR